MSHSKDENQFNEEWRSLFENAAESPSDELWDRIARRLDEEESEPIIPLWTRFRPWAYGAAASLLAILLGWWTIQSTQNTEPNRPIAGQTSTAPNRPGNPTNDQLAKREKPSAETATDLKSQTGNAGTSDESIAANRQTRVPQRAADAPELERTATAGTIDSIIKDQSVLAGRRKTSPAPPATKNPAEVHPTDAVRLADARRNPRTRRAQPGTEVSKPMPEVPQPVSESTELVARSAAPAALAPEAADQRVAFEATYIKSKAITLKNPRPISRIIWYRAPEPAIEPQEKGRSKKEYWAAVSATPVSFNPMASVYSNASLNQPYVSSNSIQLSSRQQSSASLQNQAQLSMAWQASSGVRFSKHWSVEAGVQYLNGRSQTRNNASVTNVFTNQTESLLVNAIRNSSPTVAQNSPTAPADPSLLPGASNDKSNVVSPSYQAVIPAEQLVSNNFQYLQVPVQFGYHILPGRKINYSILGGLMANVFLKNTIGTLEVNPDDQVYRPMTLAGTAGLRINYHPTHHWSGSLTGSYQQALQDGAQTESQVQVRPQAIGVGFGLNYHF
ncbi:hypothetical protein ACO2Q8_27275 [Larkinella sp. VNQ87]|uniref:hypothetical protein n=1 Tax=Larkinella sp. VNQ87 TaxID=3400921 RepID=UPI003C0F2120